MLKIISNQFYLNERKFRRKEEKKLKKVKKVREGNRRNYFDCILLTTFELFPGEELELLFKLEDELEFEEEEFNISFKSLLNIGILDVLNGKEGFSISFSFICAAAFAKPISDI